MTLIDSLEDAENFSRHPVSAYDPFYTRDTYLYHCCFADFVGFLRGAIASNPDSHSINYCHHLYYQAVVKTQAYEKATGVSLLDGVSGYSEPTDETLHVSGSMFASLYP